MAASGIIMSNISCRPQALQSMAIGFMIKARGSGGTRWKLALSVWSSAPAAASPASKRASSSCSLSAAAASWASNALSCGETHVAVLARRLLSRQHMNIYAHVRVRSKHLLGSRHAALSTSHGAATS